MIDTKELRIRVEEDGKGGIDLEEIHELLDRLEAAESARRDDYQNWMTALDRNAELLAKLEAAEKERDWHAERCEDAMNECNALRAMIETMEQMRPAAWYSKQYGFVYMSRQADQFEHGATLYLRNGTPAWRIDGGSKVALLDMALLPHGTVFYIHPGAKGE